MAKTKEAAPPAAQTAPKPKKQRKWPKRLLLSLIILGLLGFGAYSFLKKRGETRGTAMGSYIEAPAERRNVVNSLSYSGTLEPADSYTVTSLVSGEILNAAFEEGDQVAKDDVLYTIDSSDATTGVQRAENSLA